jgi:hypothetical protein
VTPGLAQAIAEVAERMQAGTVEPPTVEKNLIAMTNLGEGLDEIERQRQREAADPAA